MANNEINKIRVRRGLSADLKQLDEAEPGFATDTGKMYVGTAGGKNVCINPDPDKALDEASKNYVENAVVAKAVNALDKRVKKLEPVIEYGIRWPHGASSPDCERVTRQDGVMKVGADTGLSFTVESDGSFTSSYDDIYPWSDMQRVTLAGQVMVEIPKYYILLETVSGYDYIWVCKEKLTGYRCAAIFLKADGKTENDFYYVGAYESCNGALGLSQTGKKYSTAEKDYQHGWKMSEYRTAAQALGSGWGITPIAECCDLWQILVPIEFGTRDVQSVAAGICSLVDGPHDEFYESLDYHTGMTDGVNNHHGIALVTANAPDGANYNYSNQTGLNCGANPFVYRGVENPYGCIEKWVDGLTFYKSECYTTNDRTKFKTDDVTGYTKVGYDYAKEPGYIHELGYDANVPYCRLPIEVEDSSATHYCDYWDYYISNNNAYIYASFGGFYCDLVGVWYCDVDYQSTDGSGGVGSRLSYSPV